MIVRYVIELKPGLYSQGTNWQSTEDIGKAKFYAGTGPARGAMSYHRDPWSRRGYTPKLLKVECNVVGEVK